MYRRAETRADRPLTAVILSCPFCFVDNYASAAHNAGDELASIAARARLPTACYFETQIYGEHVALVADIGGGITDFAVVRIGPERRARADRWADILSAGDLGIGGANYGRDLSMSTVMPLFGPGNRMVRGDIDASSASFCYLATWSSVHLLHEPTRFAEIPAIRREAAEPTVMVRMDWLAETGGSHGVIMAV